MPIEWEEETDNLLVTRANGRLLLSDVRGCEAGIEPLLKSKGKMKLLLILDNFEGWEPNKGWKDFDFMNKNDKYLSQFAQVGDERWRNETLMFTLAGLRPIDIRYFTSEVEAREWLTAEL